MKCKNCGIEIPDDSLFCFSCGVRIEAPKTPESQTMDTAENVIGAADAAGAAGSAKPKKWYRKPWLYVALAVVIAAAVLIITGIAADIVAFVSGGPAASLNSESAGPQISFNDALIEYAVRNELNITGNRKITEKEAAGVTKLDLEGCALTGLEELAQFKNLTSLNLKNNNIKDLSPLAELTNLKQLDLQTNLITDVSALSGLCNLTDLQLSNNKISEISALSEMVLLNRLYLDKNLISEISSLKALQGLKELDLSDNKISGVETLADLSRLEFVNLSNNQISDITPLSKLTNIKEIKLNGNLITDVSVLPGLSNITDLQLSQNNISDISVLAGCGCLTKLSLQNNPVEDISPVSQINSLKSIDLRGTRVKDISTIAGKVEIQMDQPETIEISLAPGEYFMTKKLKLPFYADSAQITWTSSNEKVVTVEEGGKIQTTNVHSDPEWAMDEQATIEGKIENVSAVIKCSISVHHDACNYSWDSKKKLKYRYGYYETKGYGYKISPTLYNVIGVDLDYSVYIAKGKIKKYALRAYANSKWKNFGTINITKEKEGTVHISFGKKVKITRFWMVPKVKRTGQWNYDLGLDTIYYAKREANLGDLQIGAEQPKS